MLDSATPNHSFQNCAVSVLEAGIPLRAACSARVSAQYNLNAKCPSVGSWKVVLWFFRHRQEYLPRIMWSQARHGEQPTVEAVGCQ